MELFLLNPASCSANILRKSRLYRFTFIHPADAFIQCDFQSTVCIQF